MKGVASHLLAATLLVVATTAIVAPRFNRCTGADNCDPHDAAFYADVVRWVSGASPTMPLTAPFSRRPGAPILASFLPYHPTTAINLVNWFTLIVAAAAVFMTLRKLGLTVGPARIGCAFFVVSFPTFYYGAIGYIDPVLVACIALLTLAISAGTQPGVVLALAAGCLVKETMLASLPACIAAAFIGSSTATQLRRRIGALLAASTAAMFFALTFVPAEVSIAAHPSWEWLQANLRRPRTWASLALTFGPIGCALVAALLQPTWRRQLASQPLALPYAIGLAAHVALVAISFTASVADGRTLWTCYPYAIALVGLAMQPTTER